MNRRFTAIHQRILKLAACLFAIAIASAGSAFAATPGYPLTVTDGSGHTLTFTQAPTRVASIFLGADEMLLALLPSDRIVMVSAVATDPSQSFVVKEAQAIPNKLPQADAEKIVAVHPDIVFAAPFNNPDVLKQLDALHVKVYQVHDTQSIDAIEQQLLVIGNIVGESKRAQAIVADMKTRLAVLAKAEQGITHKVTVLDYSPWQYTAGSQTSVDDTIRAAGGINVAAAAGVKGWAKIGDEQIVKLDPDVIIYSDASSDFRRQLMNDPALQNVTAIKTGRVIAVPSRDLGTLSQHIVDAAADLAHLLYPNASWAK